MLMVKNKRYVKKYVVGGAGIFDTVSGFFKRLTTNSLATNLSKAAASDIGKTAIDAAKTVGKELATSAISKAKDIAIEKGKKLIDKIKPNPPVLTQKSKDILASLISNGQGLSKASKASNAIRIEELVKQMNGSGLRKA